MPRTVAFIPVRGGSKSIPLKNIKPMCGKPLVYWTAAAANGCEAIDEVFIATDSGEIRATAEGFGLAKVRVIGRSAESASDGASTESAMLEFAREHEFDDIVLIQATSPLLEATDLDKGFMRYSEPDVDSVISVVEDKRFYWREGERGAEPMNYDVFARPRRQDFDGCLMENGAFYITSRKRLLDTRNRVSGRIAASIMPPDTAYEIDEPEDWAVIEALLRRRMPLPNAANIKVVLTDCDGCLTDAGMYYSEAGDELKKFNTRDGMAFQLLRGLGLRTGMITSENSKSAAKRAKKLKMDFCEIGCKDKIAAAEHICAELDIGLDAILYIGDDVNDAPLLARVGISCCPADACSLAKSASDYVAQAAGGEGVVREIAQRLFGLD